MSENKEKKKVNYSKFDIDDDKYFDGVYFGFTNLWL